MECKLTDIKTVPGLGVTPARVNRLTGTVFLNDKLWDKLSKDAQDIILLHETGHYCKQTKSEIKADKYAFDNFIGTKKESLKRFNKVISETLSIYNNLNHAERYRIIAARLLLHDFINFDNKNAYKTFKKMKKSHIQKLFIDYLKEKEITNVNSLSNEEKELLLTDFMLTDEMQNILIAEAKNKAPEESNFVGFAAILSKIKNRTGKKSLISVENKTKIKGFIGQIAGKYINGIASGLNFSPNTSAIADIVNPANNLSAGKTNDNGGKPPEASAEAPKTEAEKEKEKKKKIYIFSGIGFVVIVITVTLILVFKNR